MRKLATWRGRLPMAMVENLRPKVNGNAYGISLDLGFLAAATAGGLLIGNLKTDGKIHRCPTATHPKSKNGAYKLSPLEGGGWFKDWASGDKAQAWFIQDGDSSLTEGEKLDLKRKRAAARKEADEAQRAAQAIAAEKAEKRWELAEPAVDHRYLEDKGCGAHGARIDGATLLIPVRDIDGRWMSLQRIYPDGSKFFEQDGAISGGMFVLGEIDPYGVILIGEGFSTMATCHEATDFPAVVAFNASNVPKIAKALRAKYPNATICICADNDHETRDASGKLTNPGLTNATSAAKLAGAALAVPTVGTGKSDFNDMAAEQGIDAVAETINAALDAAVNGKKHKVAAKANPATVKREKPKAAAVSAPAFEVDKTGAPRRNIRNLKTALSALDVSLAYDEFAMVGMINGEPSKDSVVNKLLFEIEEKWDVQFPKDYFFNAIDTTAREKSYHPVRDYLNGLEWDGVTRLDSFLIKHCGAADTEITRAVTSKWMIGAVRRIFSPGCIMRTVLILEGEQWIGKSSIFRILATRNEWFLDELSLDGIGRDILPQVMGKWIVELPELDAMRKAAVTAVKKNISQTTDRGRLAHARYATELPRQFIYGGTTNKKEYLNDPTGATRFWPVEIFRVDFKNLTGDVDQLWAEAVSREREGESHELDADQRTKIKEIQDEKSISDPWQDLISNLLSDESGEIFNCKIRGETLFAFLDVKKERQNQALLERLGAIMSSLGFVRKKARWPSQKNKSLPGYVIGTGEFEKTF
jgi:putative DNA primase/helicase